MRPRRERVRGNLFPNRLSGVPQKNGTTRPLSPAPALGPTGVLIYKTTILAAGSFSLQECRGSDIRNSPDQCRKLVAGRTTCPVVQSCLGHVWLHPSSCIRSCRSIRIRALIVRNIVGDLATYRTRQCELFDPCA